MKRKDKKETDEAAQKQHLNQIRANKASKRETPNLDRDENVPIKLQKKSFLIISEGKNTEISYFEQFKLSNAEVIPVGTGYNTESLVKLAIKIRKSKNKKRKAEGKEPFDFVWCVFDADPKPDNLQQLPNFLRGIQLAKKNNMKVAYSNQAFEYWLILHFEDHQGGSMPRKPDYHNKINGYINPFGCDYDEDSKEISKMFFERMLEIVGETNEGNPITRQDIAIKRAKRILKFHTDNGTSPEMAESSTTVFELVEEMKKYM
jgi:hypothetical protein